MEETLFSDDVQIACGVRLRLEFKGQQQTMPGDRTLSALPSWPGFIRLITPGGVVFECEIERTGWPTA
jgi:hypothetical protein